jgi:hypothetical protein
MQDVKWLFVQQKSTLQTPHEVYMYSENALKGLTERAEAPRLLVGI